ncbi:MAG: serine hydrolase, partial [Clostridia bacterium]|nr:serine hydrolase [Clostridia bacterium]
MFKRLEDLFEKFLGMGVPGYDCVIMKDGRCIYRHFGGYSDVEKKIAVNGTERLELYSCSKVITCVAAM